jgi:hypothetical protein
MAANLKPEDYELLDDLYSRSGGTAQILSGRRRDGANRLVAAEYATVRALNLSDLEYTITELGRAARVYAQRSSRIGSRSTGSDD